MVTNCHEETETLFSRSVLVAAKIIVLIVLDKRVMSMTYEYESPFIRQLSFVAYEFGLLRASSAYGSFIKPAGAAPADPGFIPWFLQAEIADPRTENFERLGGELSLSGKLQFLGFSPRHHLRINKTCSTAC